MANCILLTIDSLRSDYFTPDRFSECYPRFEADFEMFSSAYANGVATPFSFPALLAGELVRGNGVLPESSRTLAEIATDAIGYSNNPLLNRARGYERGFDRYRSEPIREWHRRLAARITSVLSSRRTAEALLRNHVSPRTYFRLTHTLNYTPADVVVSHVTRKLPLEGGLLWAHFMDPHFPHTPADVRDRRPQADATVEEIREANALFGEREWNTLPVMDEELDVVRNGYERNVRFVDRQLSRLFGELERRDQYRQSLIVVTADHGEAFGEKGVRNHEWGADPIDELIRVPLAIKYPAEADTGQSQALVGHRDLYDGLADWLASGGESRFSLDGSDRVVSKSNSAIRVTTDDGWMVRRRDGSTDRSGTVDEESRERLSGAEFPGVRLADGETPGVDSVTEHPSYERLEALGYV